jgi:hypothetical protein
MTTTLQDSAILVNVTNHTWTINRKDRNATAKVERATRAKHGRAFGGKVLIEKEYLDKIKRVQGKIGNYTRSVTFAWLDDGSRIMPTEVYLDYLSKVGELKDDLEIAIDEFCAIYPDLVEEAQDDLGDMFNPREFPSVGEIRRRFSVDIKFYPLPAASDFRCKLRQTEVDRMSNELETMLEHRLEGTVDELLNSTYDHVKHVLDALERTEQKVRDDKGGKTFNDNMLVKHVFECSNLMGKMNLTGNKDIEKMRKAIKSKLGKYDVEELRDKGVGGTAARREVSKAARKLLNDIEKKMNQ